MNVTADGKSWFDAARDRALRKMDNCPPGDGFSVLFMKDSPVWIVPAASADAAKVKREIEALHKIGGDGELEWFGWFFDQGFMSLDEEMRQIELFAKHIIPEFR